MSRSIMSIPMGAMPTTAIATDSANGLPGVETVRSPSKLGHSMVQVVFDQNADINRAR